MRPVLAFVGLAVLALAQSPIATGDLVVVRIGDGSAALTNAAAPTFLDQLTTAGTPMQTIALPTTVNGTQLRLTNSGTASSEGFLNLSGDHQYLVLGGYDAAVGTTSVAGTSTGGATPVLRVIGRVDLNLGIDTSTALTAYSGGNLRSVTTNTGNEFWTGGSNAGIQFVAALGATTSTQVVSAPNNVRVVGIKDAQLYTSSASGTYQGVSAIGTGLPQTTGQTATLLPGFPTTTGPSSYDWFFADATTLYVADDRTTAAGGIQKWSFNGTTWSIQYTLNPPTNVGCRGLTGIVVGGVATLYATTTESSANRVVSVTDTGATSTFTVLSTAPTNTVYRGIRLIRAPVAVTPVGAGCPGTGGLVPLLSTQRFPTLNSPTFNLSLTQAMPNSAAFLFASIGTDPVGIPVGGGCVVHLDFPTLSYLLSIGFIPIGPIPTDPSGTAILPFPIPDFAPLAGVHVGLQVAIADPTPSTGFTLTNALDLLVN